MLKVKYIGKDLVAMTNGKVYEVISVEKGWYRIMSEIGEDYLFPPEAFEIVEQQAQPPSGVVFNWRLNCVWQTLTRGGKRGRVKLDHIFERFLGVIGSDLYII